MPSLGIFICGFIVGIVSMAVVMASVEFIHAYIEKSNKRIPPGK